MDGNKRLSILLLLAAISLAPGCGERDLEEDGEGKAADAALEKERPAHGECTDITTPQNSGEGMWPWSQLGELNEEDLRERGLEIGLKDLWTPGKGGLFGAAVGLRGCSASFVSPDGLMITNHHCAFRAIQRNSTEENNILEDGFLARTREEELDGQGLRAYVFRKQSDVTDRVLGDLPEGLSDLERMKHIEAREKQIVKECEQQPNTRCRVSRNNDGLGFILLENLELGDVRLVAAPPRSIGEFGGEVDNWQWPRHTMDFALVRAYVDPDGKPAQFSKDNVPYKPDAHFEVGSDGVSPGDLVMVVGTPYRTARYRTLASVKEDLEWYYPLREDLFSKWLDVLERNCARVPESCLPTSSMVKSLNNALTNARGMTKGLKRADILSKKRSQESEWRDWVLSDEGRKARWGKTLDELSHYIEQGRDGRDRDFLIRYLLWGVKMVGFSRTITKWAAEQRIEDDDREPGFQQRDRENIEADLRQAQGSLDISADRKVLEMFLARFAKLPEDQRIAAFDEALKGKYDPESISAYVEGLYSGTGLGDMDRRLEAFGKSAEELEAMARDDRMIALGLALAKELDEYDERIKAKEGALSRLRPPYIESLVEMRGKHFYPDANASPRVSFATVAGYRPRDGEIHTPRTTLNGLLAKVTAEKPFDAPPFFCESARAQEPSSRPYADETLGDVPVCFLSNADTTGGNSGSPALDGKGRLVGLNFDRVYENISGDYGYNPALSRNIMVEIRSVLWYLSQVAKADNILEELMPKSSE